MYLFPNHIKHIQKIEYNLYQNHVHQIKIRRMAQYQ